MQDFRIIHNHRHLLGESPLWDSRQQVLYWVDINSFAIYAYNELTQQHQQWKFSETVGSLGLCESGRLLIALRSGLYFLDPRNGSTEKFLTPPGEPYPNTRLNDGKVAPDGRFIVGTLDETFTGNIGKLYAIDASGNCALLKEGFMVSNGLAWNADGTIMYHACTRWPAIWASNYIWRQTRMNNERIFAQPSAEIGHPDGAATDIEGGYWSAGVSSGYLNRYTARGELDQQIRLPFQHPTMLCFGGEDMQTIYVTSLSYRVSEDDFAKYPLSGSVIALRANVAGVPVARFNDAKLA